MVNSFENISYKRHFHSYYSVSLVLEGECFIDIKKRSYKISKGMIRVVNPYEIHEIKPSSWKHKNLSLSLEVVREILGKTPYFQNIIKDEKIKSLFLREYDLSDLKWLAEYLFENYLSRDFEAESLQARRLQKAKLYMQKIANEDDINIDKIAFYAGFSKYHFIREFKKEFGLTPYHYIHNLKINNAREMLKNGTPLSQIAQICGFTDQSHFIKIYKKFYGHTPSKVSNNRPY